MILWLTSLPVVKADTNFLINISGNVKLKREGWSNYIPVGFGTMLRSADLLHIDGQATVLCADLTPKPVSGILSTPCENNGILDIDKARFFALRFIRGASQTIPYILYPRNMLVFDNRPLLRWHDTGASSYTAAIMKGGAAIWDKRVIGSKLKYPADAPALQPNIDYLLWVVDNDRGTTSSQDPERGLGFQVVTAKGLTTIKAHREQIMALNSLENTARQFALGVYYTSTDISVSGFRPLGEAWRIFKDLVQKQDSPAIHLLLGNVLTEIKLPNEAQTTYKNALVSARKLGDSESQALSHASLWMLTGDEADYMEALNLFNELGDEIQADALKKEKVQ